MVCLFTMFFDVGRLLVCSYVHSQNLSVLVGLFSYANQKSLTLRLGSCIICNKSSVQNSLTYGLRGYVWLPYIFKHLYINRHTFWSSNKNFLSYSSNSKGFGEVVDLCVLHTSFCWYISVEKLWLMLFQGHSILSFLIVQILVHLLFSLKIKCFFY